MNPEPSNSQILEAINGLKSDFTVFKEVQEGHLEMTANIKVDIELLKERVGGLEVKVGGLEVKVGGLEAKVGTMSATMVTKDYLDEKLGVTRGHTVELIRKEDERVSTLIGALQEKEVLSHGDVRMLESLKPLASL